MIRKGFLLFLLLSLSGCIFLQSRRAEVYPMSHDQAYLVALSAIDELPSWRLAETDETNGMITVEWDGLMAQFFDPRTVKISVQKISPYESKVELVKGPMTILDRRFFSAIDRRMAERAAAYPA